MIVRGVGRALAGLALVLGTVTACDDNPLSEDRDEAAYFRLNPSSVAVNAGGEVLVDAVLVNKFGGGLNQAVTGTPCDNKITAVPDSARSVFEFPERFRIRGSNAIGNSCLIVTGGGISDTIAVRVVPDTLVIVGVDTLASGVVEVAQVQFLNEQGQPTTGLGPSNVTFASGNTTIATIDSTGSISPRAPGTTTVTATLRDGLGVSRTTTTPITVVAGPFTGAVAQAAAAGGQYVTFTQGALPFDADTEVRVQVPSGFFATLTPSMSAIAYGQSSIRVMLPPGLPSGSVLSYDLINLGPNQVATRGTFTTTAAGVDTWTGTASAATAPSFTAGSDAFGTISAAVPVHWLCFTAARTGTHTMTVHWNDGSDIDVVLYNATGTTRVLGRETGAHPETGTASLTAGTKYCVENFMYEAATAGNTTFRIRIQ